MHAVIFDIDGTLLESCAVDGDLYREAVRGVLGDIRLRDGWGEYTHVTDTGIMKEICSDNARRFNEGVCDLVREVFQSLLAAHVAANGPFREIPGALAFLKSLQQRSDVQVAFATGGWRSSATLKLSSAGFPVDKIPLASATDHHERRQIMLQALALLSNQFETVTYFGDGVWDREATRALGWHFVAVGAKLGGIASFGAYPLTGVAADGVEIECPF